MQAEYLLDAILLASSHRQYHINVDKVEDANQKQEQGHTRKQVNVRQIGVAEQVCRERMGLFVGFTQADKLVTFFYFTINDGTMLGIECIDVEMRS